jgi:hypothetical protein
MSPSNRDFTAPLEDDNEPVYVMSIWEDGFTKVRTELEAQIASLSAQLERAEAVLKLLGPMVAFSKESTAPRTPAYQALMDAYDVYQEAAR